MVAFQGFVGVGDFQGHSGAFQECSWEFQDCSTGCHQVSGVCKELQERCRGFQTNRKAFQAVSWGSWVFQRSFNAVLGGYFVEFKEHSRDVPGGFRWFHRGSRDFRSIPGALRCVPGMFLEISGLFYWFSRSFLGVPSDFWIILLVFKGVQALQGISCAQGCFKGFQRMAAVFQEIQESYFKLFLGQRSFQVVSRSSRGVMEVPVML